MNISAPFIRRPVATSLLAAGVVMAGTVAYFFIPVAPLPEVEYPTISVSAGLPGASPVTMATAVATPLERQFGRIAGVTQMTSNSTLGSANVTLQFDLDRDINAAARDTQASINAAQGLLPSYLPNAARYRKANPSDQPVAVIALTSPTMSLGDMYDAADSILGQKISQVPGVGQVSIGGGAQPAIRVQVNPTQLSNYGLSLEDVRTALAKVNAHEALGQITTSTRNYGLFTDDEIVLDPARYQSAIVAYRNRGAVRVSDIGTAFISQSDVRQAGLVNGQPSVSINVFKQPGANIIEVSDRVRGLMPFFQASIPQAIHVAIVQDRTATIRASVKDVEFTLFVAVGLVVMVIFIFLRNVTATVIPSIAVPLSLIGTLGAMYMLNYTVDNLSLMALCIATGFVVDDAIVVIENISRHIENGETAMQAALQGSKEIGFTVISMSISLIAVFIPILLMGGIMGRLFWEFAVVLSVAIVVSMFVSLTVTPMLCAKFLTSEHERRHGRIYRIFEAGFQWMHDGYASALQWALRYSPLTALVMLGVMGLAVYLYVIVPKGFFPQQDTGQLGLNILGEQDLSFRSLRLKQQEFANIVSKDPAVESVVLNSRSSNSSGGTIQLKPLSVRKLSIDRVIARLRPQLVHIPGAALYLQASQDVRVGGRGGNAQYQYTLQDENLPELNEWTPKLQAVMRGLPEIQDVSADQQDKGLQTSLVIDRDTAARLGLQEQVIDDTLYDAFGQRQVSTMYGPINQYHVVLEVQDSFKDNPTALNDIFVKSSTGTMVPLSAFSHYESSNTALVVNHQGTFPAATVAFNLALGVSLGQAVNAINQAELQMHFPATIHASFQGTARAFQDSLSSQPWLIAAALMSVYIVLGILYESLIHPITILSTIPSAGVGAVLALLIFKTDLTIIAFIGIILLIGIVKKNAIMMIDFALDQERNYGLSPRDAIYQASLLRFRPIMMTTMAAMFGALPLAIGGGEGSELRVPLGLAIVGGLMVSQMLTLFTTPVVYLYLDQFSAFLKRLRGGAKRKNLVTPTPALAHD